MKKIAKSVVLALALVVAASVGTGSTAEAAKKVTVKKVASVDKLTGKKTITLTQGKKATLKTTVTVTPNKAANKKVTYKTSNKKVATVSSKGVITAKKKNGTAKITVTSKKNKKKKATVTVKVVAGKVTKVALDKTAATLKVGATDTLKAKVTTKGKKANKAVQWTSSNEKVATVDKNGKVTAVAVGTATITVKSTDGTNKSAKATVTVEEYKTTVAPVDKKEVAVEVEFTDVAKVQADIDQIAKFSKDTEVVVNLDGKDYTATVENGVVKINGKTVAESAKAKGATKVTVKTTIKADKIAAITAFAPASVKSVKVGTVTFTDITATSFKVNGTEYAYVVDGKNIVVTGDVAEVLKGLGDVVTVTVK
ncbi:MAG: Ig-like domain-containing protein [Lachnospiraceae bacterium]|nr:Ig-like domain-containing protein [Lachnospiraceae bacterium]